MKKLIALHLFVCLATACAASEALLDQAYFYYVSGEESAAPAEREKAFNAALKIYKGLTEHYSSPGLDYNMGNAYFQLAQYPWAILHYRRALRELPRDSKVQENLRLAEERAVVNPAQRSSPASLLLYPHTHTSLGERQQVFLWLLLATTLMLSLYLWIPAQWNKRLATALGCLSAICLLSILYSQQFAAVNAVVVQGAPLYKDAGEHYATVNGEWVVAGSTVRVLDYVQNGAWLHVETDSGQAGYMPDSRLRII